MAAHPKKRIKAGDTINGIRILKMVGSAIASSSDSSISAITSSNTAAAMINCPVGVLST